MNPNAPNVKLSDVMKVNSIPKYMVSFNNHLNYEYTVDTTNKVLKKVLFTIKDKSLAVNGDMIYFTKFVVRMEGSALYNIYLKNTEEILVKKLRGRWSDIENYLIKRNNLLNDHIDYIMYIAERGMDTYECVKAFSV